MPGSDKDDNDVDDDGNDNDSELPVLSCLSKRKAINYFIDLAEGDPVTPVKCLCVVATPASEPVCYASLVTCSMTVAISMHLYVTDTANIGNAHLAVCPCLPPCISPSSFSTGALAPHTFCILNRHVVDFPIFDKIVWNDGFWLLKVQAELEYFSVILEVWLQLLKAWEACCLN